MEKLPRHRPHRKYPQAKRIIIECDLETCPLCGQELSPRRPWHMRKTVQTLTGPVFVAGKSEGSAPNEILPELWETLLCQPCVVIEPAKQYVWSRCVGTYWLATRTRTSPTGGDPKRSRTSGGWQLMSAMLELRRWKLTCMGFIPPANINAHRSVCIVLYKNAGNFMHRRCSTVMTFQDYPRIICKLKACLAVCGVINAGSVVASRPGSFGTSARLRCCLLLKMRSLYSKKSGIFRILPIRLIGND